MGQRSTQMSGVPLACLFQLRGGRGMRSARSTGAGQNDLVYTKEENKWIVYENQKCGAHWRVVNNSKSNANSSTTAHPSHCLSICWDYVLRLLSWEPETPTYCSTVIAGSREKRNKGNEIKRKQDCT
uniref:Uncharacterized protein n=1 Tax=Trypanosoma vivax (strain Y486) TaxID=1055687 RepID=G0U7K8_TRYVY|nr:hypothetical protein, unlikely [Trypanosoma vivax Y486]